MDLREKLAAYAHEAWAGWMKYMFSKCPSSQQPHSDAVWLEVPKELYDRWIFQMRTDYADLPEDMKPSDRLEADKVLAIVAEEIKSALATEESGESDPWRDGMRRGFDSAVEKIRRILAGKGGVVNDSDTTLRARLEALVVTMREEARRIERTGADMVSAAIDTDADRIERILEDK